ncbi:5'-phosphoribosyl-monophospho-decaprenol phosphatase [Pseudonocardia thermophila]|uniref:5'-phosphoribosyl-monophospho-decaprenol phosphatase n=1 Tax=Pseudonocardia thermophila TaxID=1848 RepID=A0A1M6SQ55_PSETH|nr:5'-phosphoribosyl-monophospho-decaprenol phosphatase [Pseudonocardia thermophila]
MAELLDRTGPSPAAPAAEAAIAPPAGAEVRALEAVQQALATPPVVRTARAMSLFGEHAAGWLALGLLGAAVDRGRRRDWLTAAAGVAAAHGASIAVKRVVRRRRPDHPAVQVLVGTPSRLSFPSAHATSTTAAAVLYGRLLGTRLTAAVVPPMALSRMVLGVHYPSDVAAGTALGAAVALLTGRVTRREVDR